MNAFEIRHIVALVLYAVIIVLISFADNLRDFLIFAAMFLSVRFIG